MKSYRVPSTLCPFCKREMDAASNISGKRTPKNGDLSLCLDCGEFSAFDTNQTLRKPTDKEYEDIGADELCRKMRQAWVNMQETRSSPKPPPTLENILDKEFDAIVIQVNDDMSESAMKVGKAFFALGALSVFEIMSRSPDPLVNANTLRDYHSNIMAYLKEQNDNDN